MILNSDVNNTQTNCTLAGNVFSIKASPVAFDILSSKLYSDPILAIVRELISNAHDSHVEANTVETPIQIEMPTAYVPYFKIRDYGTGLSKEDVCELYTTFFDSTKADSNNFTGCFGLGSKTPFAYTASFSVNSYFNGVKYAYVATKKDGYPNIFSVGEESTTEANGLEITIPVQTADADLFRKALKNYIRYIPDLNLDIKGTSEISRPKVVIKKDNVIIYEAVKTTSRYYGTYGELLIKQGKNVYSVRKDDVYNSLNVDFIEKLSNAFAVVIEVPIGTFSVTPSREQLSKDEYNTKKLKEVLHKAENTAKNIIIEYKDDSFTLNELCLRAFEDKYFYDFNHATDTTLRLGWSAEYGKTTFYALIRNPNYVVQRVDYNKLTANKYSRIEQGKSLIILVPRSFPYYKQLKLFYTLANYPEFKQYDSILFVTPPKQKVDLVWTVDPTTKEKVYESVKSNTVYTTVNNKTILSTIRDFYNAVYLLNNIPKYDFDIEITSLSKLYRKYTNHSKPSNQTVETQKAKNKKIRIRRCWIQSSINNFSSKIFKVYDINPAKEIGAEGAIEDLKRNQYYQPYENVIVNKEDHDLFVKITQVFGHLENTSGENMYQKFLKRMASLANVNKEFSTNAFGVIYVAKSNLKYFKDYPIFNCYQFISYIKTQDFKCVFRTLDEYIGDLVLTFDDSFWYNSLHNCMWTEKQQRAIKNSLTYRRIKFLQKILNNSDLRPKRIIHLYEQLFDYIGCTDKLVIHDLSRWKYDNTIDTFRTYKGAKTYVSGHKNGNNWVGSRAEFKKNSRLELLQLFIYGKIKYVIL